MARKRSSRPTSEDVSDAFESTVQEGEERLRRTWPGLLATGFVGGIDVGVGLLALLVVFAETQNHLLSALAFGIGFIALTLAGSELFTENFLVPLGAVIAGKCNLSELLRLWGGTLAMNLVGGWIIALLIMTSVPALDDAAIEVARFFPELGIGWKSFALAVMGGTVITLMTWMERQARSEIAKVVAVVRSRSCWLQRL